MKRQQIVKATQTGGLAAVAATLIAAGIGLAETGKSVEGVILAVIGAVCMIAAMYMGKG